MLITRCEVALGSFVHSRAEEIKPRKRVCMHLMVPGSSNYRVINYAKTLQTSGYEVIICDVIKDQNCPSEEIVEGIFYQHICAPAWFIPVRWKLWFLVKWLLLIAICTFRLLRCDADIYHAHVEHAFLAAYIAARVRGKGLIFDTPELTMFGPAILRWPRLRLWAIHIIRWMCVSCDGYITGSPKYKPILQDLYKYEQICILRHIPPYRKTSKNTRLQEKLGLDPDTRIALYQGYLQADRGLDTLLRAAHYLEAGIVIVLMGANCGKIREQLLVLLQHEQLQDRVKILSSVSYNELLDWSASADIGLVALPPDYSLSIRYCLPNKFFEYIMAGLPVLSSKLDAIAALIEQYELGKVVPDFTPAAIGEAINAMLANQNELAAMRMNAFKAVRSGLTWENESGQLVQLYQSICLHYLSEKQDRERRV